MSYKETKNQFAKEDKALFSETAQMLTPAECLAILLAVIKKGSGLVDKDTLAYNNFLKFSEGKLAVRIGKKVYDKTVLYDLFNVM